MSSLDLKFAKVFNIPVAPDAIQFGETSLASFPSIMGDVVIQMNLNQRTIMFDLRGINKAKFDEIKAICDANTILMAKGEIDLQDLTGTGTTFLYDGYICCPFQITPSGTLSVGGNDKNYQSVQVMCITSENSVTI